MKRLMPLGLLLALGACQSSSGPRMELEEDSASIAQIKGYEMTREKGATIFTPTDKKKAKSTIVVRSVRMDERHDRTPEDIVFATREALEAMPQAEVSEPKALDDTFLEGMLFDVTFEPRVKRGKTYERKHAVLFSDNYAFHVLHTAPKGQIDRLAKDFKRVIETLQEEG